MDCSTPGLPVHHQLPEFTQTHVHWVSDAIQPSHPLLSPSLPAFDLPQHQDLFKWVSSSHQVAKSTGVSPSTSVLPVNIQDWFPLGWTGWISLQSKGLSRVFSNTTAQKHQKPGELASRKGSQRVRQDWATKHKRTALSTRSQQVTSSLEHRSLHEESTWLHKRFQLGSGSVCSLLLYAFMALVHRNPSRVKGSNPFILLAFCFFFLLHVMKNCL